MNRKNKIKAIVALAVALAFFMPGAFANVDTIGVTSNSENTGDIENIVETSTNSDTSDNTEDTIVAEETIDNAMPLGVTIYVGGGGYSTIQEGINAAGPGDTVYVYNGIYYENLTVDKSINLVGESKEGTIIDGSNGTTEKILSVIVDSVNVSSFTIRNGKYGPYFNPSSYSSITNCIGNNINYGIYFRECSYSSISDCISYGNAIYGIYVRGLAGSDDYNTITNCTCYDNQRGIGIMDSGYNTVTNSTSYNNSDYGIYMTGMVKYNEIYHNNFINNAIENARPESDSGWYEIWDNGYPSGGNYWDDYTGSDPDGDGIGNTPYVLPGDPNLDDIDNYPLMNLWPPEEIKYILNITIDPIAGGTVDVDPAGPYTNGTEVTLTANANVGWSFAGWSGSDGGLIVDNKIIMTKNMSITATFIPEVYTLTITIVGSGSVDVDPAGPYTYGTEVTLTANANVGWSFAGWSGPDGGLIVDNKIIMTKNMSITATFTKGWELPMNFTGDVLGSDTVVFGETADANNSIDPMDLVKPDAPPAPYIYTYLKTDLTAPYDILWEEYRFYDADNDLQIWDLFVETDTAGSPETVTVTIVWDNTTLATETQYEHIGLYDVLSGDLLEDMKAVGTYEFTADSGMANHFQIICSDNHAPVAVPDCYETMEAHGLNVAALGVLANDFDEDGNTLTAVLETDVSDGTLTLNAADGSFDYMPDLGFFGTDSFTYKACDGELYSTIVTVTIEVKKLNHIEVRDGWNLISMPVGESIDKTNILVRNNSVDYTWDDAITEGIILDPTFGWNSGMYTDETTLVPGEGYWMWSYQDCELLIPSNVEADNHITNLAVAWNLVGIPYDTSLEKTGINVYYNGDLYTWEEAVNEGIILDPVFGWDRASQNYALTDTFMSGYGYWVYAYHGCALKKA